MVFFRDGFSEALEPDLDLALIDQAEYLIFLKKSLLDKQKVFVYKYVCAHVFRKKRGEGQ